MEAMDDARPSGTAVLVCQGRAVANGRIAPERFDDPTAMALLRDDERVAVEQARAAEPPKSVGARMEFEMLRANAEVIVPRTVAIDDAVRARPNPQLVILGAGLDGRAWRLPELAATDVFEVDHPASQRDKRDRVGAMEPLSASLRFVPVDFAVDALDAALATAGHQAPQPTTWIWEGVVPYLTRSQVESTVRVVGGRSAPGSRLVVNYQSPSPVATLGRVAARAYALVARRHDPMAREPRRSAWTADAMRTVLRYADLDVTADDDLLTLAGRLPMTVTRRRSLAAGRVAVADRDGPAR